MGWGHSSAEFVVKLARHANVKHVILAHHDPLRTDEAMHGIITKLRDGLRADHSTVLVSAATEGEAIEVKASAGALSSQTLREDHDGKARAVSSVRANKGSGHEGCDRFW